MTETRTLAIASWQDVDRRLREIGRLDNEIAGLQAQMNRELEAVKARYERTLKPKLDARAASEAGIKDFCAQHHDDFGSQRTMPLTWGVIECRKTPDALEFVPGWTEDQVIAALERAKELDAVRVEKSVDKKAVKSWTGEKLEKFHMRLVSGHRYTVKPDMEKIVASPEIEAA